MLRPFLRVLPMLCAGFLLGCEPENITTISGDRPVYSTWVFETSVQPTVAYELQKAAATENLREIIFKAVVPSECGATEFSQIVWKHFTSLASDPLAVENLDQYLYLQENAVRLRIGTDYFGPEGEYTGLVQRNIRTLEKFWDLSGKIEVLGEHNETLNDREKLADILWYSIQDLESREDVYAMVDAILQKNALSPVLPQSPFFAADGYAAANKQIVLGDGLIQMFSETGLEEEIIWTGILSHEWAHQVQFDFLAEWYPSGTFESRAEETRTIELEADFFSGYFMTHKRGATYNWQRAEQFFELFYQAGDCSFTFEQHHGTPLQRKNASYEGYLLAEAAQKRGHILSAEELHNYFITVVLPETVKESQYL